MQIKVGNQYYYRPNRQRVTVVWENLGTLGIHNDKALVTVESTNGTPYTFPIALADRYITTEPPARPKKQTTASL